MFINDLVVFIICRCFLELDPASTRLVPNRLLEIGVFRGVMMVKIELTKSAADAAQAQAQVQPVKLRDTLVPDFLCKIIRACRTVFMPQYRTNAG